jgi:type II secretion system protein H
MSGWIGRSRLSALGSELRPGFTLIELLVALVIIGMIATVAVPALRARGGSAGEAAKELASIYETTRETAIARGRAAVAEIELTRGSYRVLAQREPDRPADTLRQGTLALPTSARLSSRAARGERARMSFDPLGRAHGDDVVITDGKARYQVVADPWTGSARVAVR